ncbi:hypothetical protein, partial [Amycolatopsis jejuensis]|uniref:hypothetical protein n=1 Tax=Amycolatopsis jejuensis TaxID=330084 RepID=UPI003CCC0186
MGVVVDGGGGTLVAGLHDMHGHVDGWGGLFALAAGVTSVRDMGNVNERLLELEECFESGELAGPTITRSGYLDGVRGPGGYGITPFTTPDKMIEAGYDEITHVNQLMLGWLIDETEDTLSPLRIMGLTRAAKLDLTSEPVRRTLNLMHDHGIGLDTTVCVMEGLLLCRDGKTLPGDEAILDHLPPAYQHDRRHTYLPHESEEDLATYEQSFAKVMDTLRLLRAEGIPLWPGTDDNTGFSLHRELELYTQAGY